MTLYVDPSLKEFVRHQLGERAARGAEQSARPVTTVKSKALHNLQFRATVEGHEFISDERESAAGNDAGPAPLRYFLAGAMMCHQVWCVKSAALADVKIDRLESEISGYLEGPAEADDPDVARGFSRATLTVFVDSPNAPDEVRSIVQQASNRCPAFVTLYRGARIDLTVVHNGASIHEQRYGGQAQ